MRKLLLALCAPVALAAADDVAFSPLLNANATRGLPQTISAEPLGAGRISFMLRASTFTQDQELGSSSAPKNAAISTYSGAFAYGLNDGSDIFGSIYFYSAGNDMKGIGSGNAGFKFSLPFPEGFPVRIGVLGQMIAGLSDKQVIIDRYGEGLYRPDGYNYQETRTGYDFQALALQSIIVGDEADLHLRIHGNEGISTSLQDSVRPLLLLGGGLEFSPVRYVALACEANWRTLSSHISAADPLWVSPSLHLRSSAGFNVYMGADVRASQNRAWGQPKALAPWRATGGVSFSFDIFAKDREAARLKVVNDSLSLIRLRKDSIALSNDKRRLGGDSLQLSKALAKQREELRHLSDSLTRRESEINAKDSTLNVKDSILAARMRELAMKDSSLAAAELARHRQMSRADSLEAKHRLDSAAHVLDSLAMAKKLEEERAKRNAFEKDLIQKGVARLEAVYFDNGKAELSINSKPYLQMIGDILAKYPKLKIEVGGHTDSKGVKAANLKLSTGRAKSVRDFFVDNFPQIAANISFKGYGSAQPKASNATPAGRLQNRRVEMKVLNPEVLKEYISQ